MINARLSALYTNYFKVVIFIYAIGCWIFMNQLFNSTRYAIAALILFGILLIIPVHKFISFVCLEMKEQFINDKDYNDVYFNFGIDYERANPITRQKGFQNYIEKLYEAGILSDEEFRKIHSIMKSNSLNILELYHRNNNGINSKESNVGFLKMFNNSVSM
jgi:hypothetical protein